MFAIDSKVLKIAFCYLLQAMLALGLIFCGRTAQAQATYPDRPVRLVVAYGPGGNAPDVRERIIGRGADPVTSTPAEFDAFIAAEIKKWIQVIKDSGARYD